MFALFCATLFAIALVAAIGTIVWMVKDYGRKMMTALAGQQAAPVPARKRAITLQAARNARPLAGRQPTFAAMAA